MMLKSETVARLRTLATKPGVITSVDGQYGSTGKGVINGAMGQILSNTVNMVVTNAGPNSGHTNYFGNQKIVLKQLPTFGVTAHLTERNWEEVGMRQQPPHIRLSAGAVINPSILKTEMDEYQLTKIDVSVHRNAALIDAFLIDQDQKNVSSIASTGQGVGPALLRKTCRYPDAVWGQPTAFPGKQDYKPWDIRKCKIYMEVSQGYSLGINSGFYPHVTSRECTVSQAMADAQLPPNLHNHTIMSVRTFPIRVGNTDNTSGPYYPDQTEITWDEIGVEPEFTTVTGRQRRVFTWSAQQYVDALLANDPDVIFLNFCNYLPGSQVNQFVIDNVMTPYVKVLNRSPIAVILGFGPKYEDLEEWGQ